MRDFIGLRAGTFGFELAALPASLPLPAEEDRMNRFVNPRVLANSRPAERNTGGIAVSAGST